MTAIDVKSAQSLADTFNERAKEVLEAAQALPAIGTAAERDQAVAEQKTLAGVIKSAQAERDDSCKPVWHAFRKLSNRWAPGLKALDQAKKIRGARIAAFEALKKAAAQVALQGDVAREEIDAAVEIMSERPRGTSIVRYYSAEVVDPKLVPESFKMPDIKALNAEARTKKEAFSVPGVKLIVKETVIVNGK